MAADAVDTAIATAGLSPSRPCRTEALRLVGGGRYSPSEFVSIKQTLLHPGVEFDLAVAKNLARSYGDRAPLVVRSSMRNSVARAGWMRTPLRWAAVVLCGLSPEGSQAVSQQRFPTALSSTLTLA